MTAYDSWQKLWLTIVINDFAKSVEGWMELFKRSRQEDYLSSKIVKEARTRPSMATSHSLKHILSRIAI